MKSALFILTILCLNTTVFCQEKCEITEVYAQIFTITKETFRDREFLMKKVNPIDSSSCFSKLINENIRYIDYLRTHFTDNSKNEKLKAIKDSIKLQRTYIKHLKNDSVFNSVMQKLTKKTPNDKSFVADTISTDDLMNIAVKFFSIKGITQEGYYEGKVCVGINGIKLTEPIRQPHVEAFCFTTILNHLNSEEYNLYNEFVNGIKALYTLNLGIDANQRLLRAQGAMFMYMRNNEILKKALLATYRKKKDFLPFVLTLE